MFTMFITPHTRENPRATRANSPPWRRPLMVAWRNWVKRRPLPLSERRGGPLQRCAVRALGPHRHCLAVLDLDHRHRLVDVLPLAVELDLAEEGHRVQGGHRVAHRCRL